MAYLYLLDSNIISYLIKHPKGDVAQQIRLVGEDNICTSIIVACELRFGVIKSGSSNLAAQLSKILDMLPILPLVLPIEDHYAEIHNHLERLGTPIGPNDLLIAAHAQLLDLTIIITNVNKFSRVPNLMVENWLQSS
jgi:tRNA(fMet)-specific endonuclease VapC